MKFLDSYNFLDSSLNKLSKAPKSFSSLGANVMEDELFKKMTYPYVKGQSNKSFYKPLILGTEDYFSTLKQSYSDF